MRRGKNLFVPNVSEGGGEDMYEGLRLIYGARLRKEELGQ